MALAAWLRAKIEPRRSNCLKIDDQALENQLMRNPLRHRIEMSSFAILLAGLLTPALALAQSGSVGGSIGNDEKSLSGSRQAPRSVEPDQPAGHSSKPAVDAPRRTTSHGSGGGGNFDGAWSVVSVGCAGSSTGAAVVSNGRIIGQGVTGTVSANGSVRSVGNYNGIIVTSYGHVSGSSGSGTFQRSDGCSGRWTSSKQ